MTLNFQPRVQGELSNSKSICARFTTAAWAGAARVCTAATAVAAAASLVSALMLGFTPRYAPASDSDAAAVDEIVG